MNCLAKNRMRLCSQSNISIFSFLLLVLQPFRRLRQPGAAKQRLWMGPGRCLCRRGANSNTDPDTNAYAYTYTYTYTYSNSYPDTNANAYTYGDTDADTGSDHAQGLRTKGAGEERGGSSLEWGELGQYRHLPRWSSDRDSVEHGLL
jgi:hypothetical protein